MTDKQPTSDELERMLGEHLGGTPWSNKHAAGYKFIDSEGFDNTENIYQLYSSIRQWISDGIGPKPEHAKDENCEVYCECGYFIALQIWQEIRKALGL